MSKHKRASSNSFGADSWTADSHGIMGTAMGVGKGMFGKAAGATRMLTGPRFSSSPKRSSPNLQKLTGGDGSISKYLQPTSQGYPKYETTVSTDFITDIPLLKIRPPTSTNSVAIEVGPGEGLFECSDELAERKKILKNLTKKLQQNPNALRENDSPYVKYDLGMEDIKLKLAHLKEVEKKLKPQLAASTEKRKGRMLLSDPRVAGQTTDTYAFDAIRGEKAGQPNADSFYAEGFPRNLCFGVADGIGWGVPSRRASQAALLGFSTCIKAEIAKRLQKTVEWDTVMLAEVCRNALEGAHIFVNANTEAKTTFAGGMIVELCHQTSSPSIRISHSFDSSSEEEADNEIHLPTKWAFVGVSVGDTLVYRFSSMRNEVKEITVSDRTFGVRDAGGSLGGSEPDYRNLGYHFCLLEEGDFIIAVSDGVHDNLDPEVLQRTPSDCGLDQPDNDWKKVPDDQKNIIKRKFKEEQLCTLVNKNQEDQPTTSQTIVNNVIEFVWESTFEHRRAYERGSELQRDWDKLDSQKRDLENQEIQGILKNPIGKFDHVTCLCVRVSSI